MIVANIKPKILCAANRTQSSEKDGEGENRN